ncbi:MAG: 23S rRNA (adenine(2503)-C(2))-methyltransferase RlmN [Clostridiales bacterium]|nr:23S rRNA (adenine(2503)-C(2))-methyltransferase RlmN [Clostridiales bacterium]
MDKEELKAWLAGIGQPAYRADQLFAWLHKGAAFSAMSNLPKTLVAALERTAIANPVTIVERRESAVDGTRKYLFGMQDGHCVEGVLMRYSYGNTLCISTQVGCRMGCTFCASTLEGCVRNLSADEMLGQVLCARMEPDEGALRNIVLMGSGEPLDNYDETVRFLRLVTHPDGINLSVRHISLSTCGLADAMLRFADEGLPVTLSVSLHAPNDALRRQLMPVARRYPIARVMDACRNYIQKTGRRVIFEYALIGGVNTGRDNARQLACLLRGMQCHVNLIPLNDVSERDLRGASRGEIQAFLNELTELNISVSLRREMGDDISGACGQLRRSHLAQGALAPEVAQ